jgi:hypothetical protein
MLQMRWSRSFLPVVTRGLWWATLGFSGVACGGGGGSHDSTFSSGGSAATQGQGGSVSNGNGGTNGSNGGAGVTGSAGSGALIGSAGNFSGVGGSSDADVGGNTGCASLSGTVWTPGKTDPLYNAIVYVAKGSVEPVASGASCDRCGDLSASKALTATLTGPDGKFALTGVPIGDNIPLVIQIGKWRRVVSVNVTGCHDTPVPDDLTRMPKNQGEGNIPLTAISTGGADTLECILRKMGIDDAEFTLPSETGRIHLYHATGALASTGTTPDQAELWTNIDNLKRYDMVILPCEHAPNTSGKTPGYQNLVSYAEVGGRAFVTHYNYTWIRTPTTLFSPTANWTSETKYFGDTYDFPMTADVNVAFPKGKDFAQWLVNVGASTTYGSIQLNHVVHNADSELPDVAQSWLTSSAQPRQFKPDGSMASQQILHHYTFNTPVGAAPESQCGRVVYSAFHVNDASSDGKPYPTECNAAPLTPQEKVLMFMMFDLASCVQTDKQIPMPPVIR